MGIVNFSITESDFTKYSRMNGEDQCGLHVSIEHNFPISIWSLNKLTSYFEVIKMTGSFSFDYMQFLFPIVK